ncbi:nibrin [Trichonephila clavipes]|nr:nibrin [Trichonephila clavipes]
MTGHIYRDVILEQHVRLFRGAIGAEFLFMDDNAPPHRANIIDECLQSEDITCVVRPVLHRPGDILRFTSPCKHCRRMPSIRGYHLYGLASILTGLESNRACVGYAWPTN